MTDREREFNAIADLWSRETAHFSLWPMTQAHPAHAQLVAFGKEGIQFAVDRMRRGECSLDMSFLLAELAECHPNYTPEVERGFAKWDVKQAARSWLKWAKENGY